MFTAALFTIARTWEQPRCPSTEKWIKMLWYLCTYIYIYIYIYTQTHTMEYYSTTKRNKIMPFAATWKDLEFY